MKVIRKFNKNYMNSQVKTIEISIIHVKTGKMINIRIDAVRPLTLHVRNVI